MLPSAQRHQGHSWLEECSRGLRPQTAKKKKTQRGFSPENFALGLFYKPLIYQGRTFAAASSRCLSSRCGLRVIWSINSCGTVFTLVATGTRVTPPLAAETPVYTCPVSISLRTFSAYIVGSNHAEQTSSFIPAPQ